MVKTQGATDHRGTVRKNKLDPKVKAANKKETAAKRNRGKRHKRRDAIAAGSSRIDAWAVRPSLLKRTWGWTVLVGWTVATSLQNTTATTSTSSANSARAEAVSSSTDSSGVDSASQTPTRSTDPHAGSSASTPRPMELDTDDVRISPYGGSASGSASAAVHEMPAPSHSADAAMRNADEGNVRDHDVGAADVEEDNGPARIEDDEEGSEVRL